MGKAVKRKAFEGIQSLIKQKTARRAGSARKPAGTKDFTAEYRKLAAKARAKGIKFTTRAELYKKLKFTYSRALKVETRLLRNRYKSPKTARKVAESNLKPYSYI